jgi:hypothetical protein
MRKFIAKSVTSSFTQDFWRDLHSKADLMAGAEESNLACGLGAHRYFPESFKWADRFRKAKPGMELVRP